MPQSISPAANTRGSVASVVFGKNVSSCMNQSFDMPYWTVIPSVPQSVQPASSQVGTIPVGSVSLCTPPLLSGLAFAGHDDAVVPSE
jgi:hypothetical protein